MYTQSHSVLSLQLLASVPATLKVAIRHRDLHARVLESRIPFLFTYLPPVPLFQDPDAAGTRRIGSAVSNSALGGTRGLLRRELDTRCKRDPVQPDETEQPEATFNSNKYCHWHAVISAKRREAQREAPSNSPVHVAPLWTCANGPPPYGAQHRQDALWEDAGGNEALPPGWQQFKVLDEARYQDDTLVITSLKRPLPGVRLDDPGDLVIPRCEWHISPLGRSYFVNHNTQTTSWKKPKPEHPAGSLMPECVIAGHSKCIWSLACLSISCDIMSASGDGSIRQWKKDGELVGKSWDGGGGGAMGSTAVSPDETMVVCGSGDGKLRLWNVKEGSMVGDPWEGHNAAVRCLDWSPDALEIASGSQDGTIRRWNPYTGQQIAPPIEASHGWVDAVKYSPRGDKFASGGDGAICIWSRNGELLVEIKGHDRAVMSLCWSKNGACIFSGSLDNTIRQWRSIDGEELIVFRGHTGCVNSLCLTPNESYLVTASTDFTIRIWDLKTNQAVGDPLLHDDELWAVAMSPDGTYIASAGLDAKVYVWSLEAALGQHDGDQVGGRPARPRAVRQPIGKDFFGNESDRAPRHATPPASSSSIIPWRRWLSSMYLGTRPANASQPVERQSRHWNFNLFSGGNSGRTVEVAPGRKKDRYAIAPPSKAEVDAAMQRVNGNQANSSMPPGQAAAGVQASQVGPVQTQAQGSTGGAEIILYEGNSAPGSAHGLLCGELNVRWECDPGGALPHRPPVCKARCPSVSVMFREVAESDLSGSRVEVRREALLDSSAHVARLRTNAQDPPPYGAQHRQDALWKGGNEALPPLWHQFMVLDETQYQDNNLTMVSDNRPFPGVRLDEPGYLVVPGWEWHISPLGRSYFVKHNTRTTSWNKPKPERPAGNLTPECVIKGHSQCIWSLAYLGTSGSIMSTSEDSSIRQWKRNGDPVGKPWYSDGGGIGPIAVSPDETMVIGGSADGRLWLWNIKEGSMISDPWEGHDDVVRCLDWSPNALEIASGSEDGTLRRWSPDTGRQIAPPIETSHGWVLAVKYSPQGDKFMSSGADGVVCIWSRNGKLLIEIKGHERGVTSLCWSKDGAHIFSGSGDHTIRKWQVTDGQELVVFRGHTNPVKSLCLTPNENHIVSASNDCSIRIWDLKINQFVGDPLLHDDQVLAVAMAPDAKYIASAGPDRKIYVWSLEAALNWHTMVMQSLRDIQPDLETCANQLSIPEARQDMAMISSATIQMPHLVTQLRMRVHLSFIGAVCWPPPVQYSTYRCASAITSRIPTLEFQLTSSPARDEDRYGITPETDAEAAAAMQRTSDNEVDNSTQSGRPEAGTQAPQVRHVQTQAQGSTGRADVILYEGDRRIGMYTLRCTPSSCENTTGKSVPLSGIERLVVHMVSCAGSSMFVGNVTLVGAGDLACCVAVTRVHPPSLSVLIDNWGGLQIRMLIYALWREHTSLAKHNELSSSSLSCKARRPSISVMFRELAESGLSGSRGEVQREALSDSSAHVARLRTNARDPPPYGAQHRQDALWKGGNEALPPLWHQYKSVGGITRYQEDTLMINSSNRPLPGVRLAPERPAGSLIPECIIEGHSSCDIMSASDDSSIRQWKRDGEPVGKPLDNKGGIDSMAVSPDETMVVCGSGDGRLRLWDIKEGRIIGDPWEGHNDAVRCLDWSPNAPEIVSGSEDGTIRRWNPDTGRQIASPIKTSDEWVLAVKYSPQGDKFASGGDGAICIWSRKGELLVEIKGHESWVMSLCWPKGGTCIFSGSLDNTIRKWRAIDGEELVVFRGHTNPVRSLCLSLNESYIVSASNDCSIRIWDLKSNQPVGDPLLHNDELLTVAMSPDGKYIASAGLDKKIYVWSLEAALKVAGADIDGNTKLKASLLYFSFTLQLISLLGTSSPTAESCAPTNHSECRSALQRTGQYQRLGKIWQ
ncbi:WD40 repeat-like protein [Suillus weaverae]|nr:WD40 repeat-like protein [Suillus weaverae]